MNPIEEILNPVYLPPMAVVRQEFSSCPLSSPECVLKEQLDVSWIKDKIFPGMTVAITVGSRGIANLPVFIRTVAAFVRACGGDPFLVPSMGSHGGASPEGQMAVLKGLGITQESVNAPIRPGVAVCRLGELDDGTLVMVDREAAAADAIILFNRIKAHTAFHGPYESGLMKMAAVGLGNCSGAEYVHGGGDGKIGRRMEALSRAMLEHLPILCGIGVLENACEETAAVHVIPREEIPVKEPLLLKQAKAMMPSILLHDLDVLVIDRIGKDISGGGMDPNVTGEIEGPDGQLSPKPRRITVLDLTEATEGAAFGIGMADTTTEVLVKKYNPLVTYPNCLMTGTPHLIRIPMALASHRQAVQAAIQMLPADRRQNPRIVRIKDTLHLQELYVSCNLLEEAASDPRLTVLEPPADWRFDPFGNLF